MPLRQFEKADPDKLERVALEAAFDHLLSPPELDHADGPFETEARQVEAKLIGFVQDEAEDICRSAGSRHHRR